MIFSGGDGEQHGGGGGGAGATHVSGAEDFQDTWGARDAIDAVMEKCRPYRSIVCHLMWSYREAPDVFFCF